MRLGLRLIQEMLKSTESKSQSEKSNYQIIKKERCGQGYEQEKEVKKHKTSKYWFAIWL